MILLLCIIFIIIILLLLYHYVSIYYVYYCYYVWTPVERHLGPAQENVTIGDILDVVWERAKGRCSVQKVPLFFILPHYSAQNKPGCVSSLHKTLKSNSDSLVWAVRLSDPLLWPHPFLLSPFCAHTCLLAIPQTHTLLCTSEPLHLPFPLPAEQSRTGVLPRSSGEWLLLIV